MNIPSGMNSPSMHCGLRRVSLFVSTLLLAGCGDIYLDAPRGANVRLLAEKSPAKVRAEQVVWFKYWGNRPFSEAETHAATIIQDKHLTTARIYMVNTFVDGLISTFTGPIGFPRRTLVVEGNPEPAVASPPPAAAPADPGRTTN
ncbi:MAG: hypothetical protein MUF20_07230 [Methylotetracoccus sp.]|jgi:hypothetical protein|nr:hypothetical protein [Methylotetracoccus sp.]